MDCVTSVFMIEGSLYDRLRSGGWSVRGRTRRRGDGAEYFAYLEFACIPADPTKI